VIKFHPSRRMLLNFSNPTSCSSRERREGLISICKDRLYDIHESRVESPLFCVPLFYLTISLLLRLHSVEFGELLHTLNTEGCRRKWSWTVLKQYAFARTDEGELLKFSVRIAEIQTRYFPNTKQQC